jgi:hypothetical protein
MENVKVISRSWGWTLKWIGAPIPKWIMSNDGTFGWYKKKKDALSSAACYNK